MTGVRNGSQWMPPKCDVSIRPGWFWHEKENTKVKTPEQLVDLYFKSVGRGASLLLNVPPNRSGLLQDTDIQSLMGFRKRLERMFAVDLAQGTKLKASNVRGASSRFDAYKLVDHDPNTYWATDDSVRSADVTIDLERPQKVSVVRLGEAIALGQRIRAFGLEIWQDDAWTEVAIESSIGACKLIRLPCQRLSTRLRLRITASDAAIALSELSIFSQSTL